MDKARQENNPDALSAAYKAYAGLALAKLLEEKSISGWQKVDEETTAPTGAAYLVNLENGTIPLGVLGSDTHIRVTRKKHPKVAYVSVRSKKGQGFWSLKTVAENILSQVTDHSFNKSV